MSNQGCTFAVVFGNRGFFPESLIAVARDEMGAALKRAGHAMLAMPPEATRFGAVESAAEGAAFAQFLNEHRGRFDGVIICLPNFGDETGMVAAVRDADVPILIQAYPDELNRMGFEVRRDAFCGKFSVMDVFCQYGIPFTAFKPHTSHPSGPVFEHQLDAFARTCRVVKGMKRMTVGAIGARTTAFKTVRFDELALQKYDITTETLDLSDVFRRVRDVKEGGDAYRVKADTLRRYTNWKNVPDRAFDNLVKLSIVLDQIVAEFSMDALALRCWIEIEKELGVSPCVLLGELNDRGVAAACELDVGNAIAMRALGLASGAAATCLDWNNNYADEDDKCILFHCGPVPQSLMAGKGQIVDHPMFAKSIGAGCGWGCNTGRIAPTPFTYASSKTQDGELCFYLGEGHITNDPIAKDFFGCAGVAEISDLQEKLLLIGKFGYRHHVSITPTHVGDAVREAFNTYLGYVFDF